MSTHNICFHGKIRKILSGRLSGALVQVFNLCMQNLSLKLLSS